MNKNIKKATLIDALSYCNLRALPEKDNGEDFWIKAIALVAKKDGSENYVILDKDDNLNNFVKKDFGNISLIAKIKEVYPFDFLKPQYIPKFNSPKKDERIAYLNAVCPKACYAAMNLKELNTEIIKVAIKQQKIKERSSNNG